MLFTFGLVFEKVRNRWTKVDRKVSLFFHHDRVFMHFGVYRSFVSTRGTRDMTKAKSSKAQPPTNDQNELVKLLNNEKQALKGENAVRLQSPV